VTETALPAYPLDQSLPGLPGDYQIPYRFSLGLAEKGELADFIITHLFHLWQSFGVWTGLHVRDFLQSLARRESPGMDYADWTNHYGMELRLAIETLCDRGLLHYNLRSDVVYPTEALLGHPDVARHRLTQHR
jgi:hypothetical protein